MESSNKGLLALSMQDRGGVTVAVYKSTSEATHWSTIGSNLIAYWDGDAGSVQLYFDAVAKALAGTGSTAISLEDLVSCNKEWGDILPIDGWIGGSVTIHVRDRLKYRSSNLLKMVISKKNIGMELVDDCAAVTGTHAPAALKVLDNLSSIIETKLFREDEQLREHIVSKVFFDALPNSCKAGFCEVIRGSPEKPWTTLGVTPVEEIRYRCDDTL